MPESPLQYNKAGLFLKVMEHWYVCQTAVILLNYDGQGKNIIYKYHIFSAAIVTTFFIKRVITALIVCQWKLHVNENCM